MAKDTLVLTGDGEIIRKGNNWLIIKGKDKEGNTCFEGVEYVGTDPDGVNFMLHYAGPDADKIQNYLKKAEEIQAVEIAKKKARKGALN